MRINSVRAREVLDSRGWPTVECEVITSRSCARASVPSGASVGSHEVSELRDGGRRFFGLGVLYAVHLINTVVARRLRGVDVRDQRAVDSVLLKIGKSNLGSNGCLAVSLACCRAADSHRTFEHIARLAGVKKFVLPTPAFNLINGGKHAGNRLDVQEFLLFPVGAHSFSEALRIGSEVYHALRGLLLKRHGAPAVNVGDEGGFAPSFLRVEEALDVILDAVEALGYEKKVQLGLDCAASSFFKNGLYFFEGKRLSAERLLARYERLLSVYPIISIEDPFFEDAFGDFTAFTERVKENVQVVGDDLTVTSTARIQQAIDNNACSCVLIKPNQVGSISETLNAVRLARAGGLNVMASHRSGETCDSFIADFAVGISAGQIKAGAPCRGERLAKYNRLLKIEELLGKKARFAGRVL